jgi:hypothetical protein
LNCRQRDSTVGGTFWRFLQRLQHRVEGVVRQHVHFVDHVDLEAPDDRLVDRLIEQLRDLVDAAVRRRIELDVVDVAPGVDVAAGVARAAGRGRDAAAAVGPGAVQALGEDARHRRLADAARAGEEIGMVQPLRFERVGKRLHDVLLADQLVEAARPVLAGEHEITHAVILRAAPARRPALRPGRARRRRPREAR